VIAVSAAVKDGLIGAFGLKEEQIKVIYNSCDVRWVAQKAVAYPVPLTDYIVSCGRLQKQKNFCLLIDSVAYLRQNKGIELPLVLVGDGSDRAELERYAAERNVQMTVTGFLDNPFPWIKQAKVFAMTSIYEGLPLVIPEAMACNVPVVAVDCPGGTREIVLHGKTGLLISGFSKEAVGEGILRLITDTGLSQQLTRAAYENVLQKFDVRQMVREYQDILR
jgi:glycosyltransferase involved in cell wall biosynthesis